MSSNGNAKELFAGSPGATGGLFWLPLTATAPTDAKTALPVTAVSVGFVSDAGVTEKIERGQQKKYAWGGDKVATLQENYDASWEFELYQFLNKTAAGVAYGAANVTITPADATNGERMAIKHNSDVLDFGIWVIDSFYGTKKVRKVATYAQPSQIGDLLLSHKELSGFKVTLDLFTDSQGQSHYTYTDDGVLAP